MLSVYLFSREQERAPIKFYRHSGQAGSLKKLRAIAALFVTMLDCQSRSAPLATRDDARGIVKTRIFTEHTNP